ncbi:MAG: HD domain-containing protein [Cellulosilyticum sp.]|nr:HD domain-containing protein [Cellulosilyticum sp.]
MRLILTKYLRDGDIIAKDITSYSGGILLRHDTRFREVFRSKLIERNVHQVYIDDELSKGIEPKAILEPTIKKIITDDVQSQFENLKNALSLDVNRLMGTTEFLIKQLNQRDLVLELDDLKVNDQYTYEHCIAVAILTNIVCDKLKIDERRKSQIVMGALIHDIGKVIIPKDILNKSSRLTDTEYEIIKDHAELGYKMIKGDQGLSAVAKLIVLCHHEREDGTGYPLGKGPELHIGAKIVAACDIFHALACDRCYRAGLPIDEVLDILDKESIEPTIRQSIRSSFACYPVGSMVSLNDGRIAIVEKNFVSDMYKPMVRVLEQKDGKVIGKYKMNLKNEKEYYIIGNYQGQI